MNKSALRPPFVPQPTTIEETGLSFTQLVDLCVKAVYFRGRPSGREISDALCLPFSVVEELLAFLKREKVIEVVGSGGISEQQYRYALTEKGEAKASEALQRNQYVGPVPVPFSSYLEVIKQQSILNIEVDRATLDECLTGLVLDATTHRLIGPAVNSGRSLLLYGKPGNGKSSVARAIGRMLPGHVLIPYAIDINGQIISVYDPRVHSEVGEDELAVEERRTWFDSRYQMLREEEIQEGKRDQRWVIARRPFVVTGGELTLPDLELKYSNQTNYYVAPVQVKANSGVLVLDDFGRQLIQPKELLNRWIVPMEERQDHLSLLTGETLEMPFEVLLIFSTNIPPSQLGDEAFFRRIRHKVEIKDPDEDSFLRILQIVCEQNGIDYSDEGGQYLLERYYRPKNRQLRGTHPRDIIDLMLDIGKFEHTTPKLTHEWIDIASAAYFMEDDEEDMVVPELRSLRAA